MARSKKSLRDGARLSGKPLSETLSPSPVLATPTEEWVTSPDLTESNLPYTTESIQDTTTFLMENPGMNSTVLFRADILFDSQAENHGTESGHAGDPAVIPAPARDIPGFDLTRTVVRKLIPRNSQLDQPLDQTCHFYTGSSSTNISSTERFLVIYTPHVSSKDELPYYHPLLQSLALLYEYTPNTASPSTSNQGSKSNQHPGTMSIHILPYPNTSIHPRLERTLTKLLEVQIRITRGRLTETSSPATNASPYAPIKDNVIPRSRVQDTYSRLKIKYAGDLCARWVEDTEPSKHVFEDLGVAAFLIELWRDMYAVVPGDERDGTSTETMTKSIGDSGLRTGTTFPGFVDIACGNGVLIYILLAEGYSGWGFDARRRKTWSIFPGSVQEYLREEIYIPKPFADVLSPSTTTAPDNNYTLPPSIKTHTATPPAFPASTFIISNHADELTLWTPLLSTLLNPDSPSPFLAIPCCSHALSGSRYRFPPQQFSSSSSTSTSTSTSNNPEHEEEEESLTSPNPSSGSLLALRASKQAAQTPHSAGFSKSTYGALTEKLVSVAREVGFEVTRTLLRIPSTRNIGVVGIPAGHGYEGEGEGRLERVVAVVEGECVREGGVDVAARNWVERARGLRAG
ncbi:hypothetical protein BJY04DRAFT_215789 [Aspergillus karnatakaensis]|uniref:tRNA (uracil) methyltransferase n=1 Tax=Aspergillus karnatakaensis TaxID=1810916 RepID=UPI003CCE12C4